MAPILVSGTVSLRGTRHCGADCGTSTNAASFFIKGTGARPVFRDWRERFGSYSYFVVARDTTTGTQTSPMQVLNYSSTGSDTITVRWPRVANGTDVFSIRHPDGDASKRDISLSIYGGCAGICERVRSVATSIGAVCRLVCTYSDNGATVTSSYTIAQGTYAGNLIFWRGRL